MTDVATLRAEVRKLSAKAVNAKMNLHDLSEELPTNWKTIMEVAQATRDAYAELDAARTRLEQMEKAG